MHFQTACLIGPHKYFGQQDNLTILILQAGKQSFFIFLERIV